MSVLEIFAAVEASPIGVGIRDSYWLFAAIEAVHLLGLSVIGGAVLLVNMRMLGFGLVRTPLAVLARDTRPYLLGSLIVMLISGFFLFASEATKCYYHGAFWVKMGSLFLAIIFSYTIHGKLANAGEGNVSPSALKLVAIVSLVLWTGVGVGGRWIGFS
jgi:hypothetical protein